MPWYKCDFINDADYPVYPKVSGIRLLCPYYTTWSNLIKRCAEDSDYKIKKSNYKDTSCCKEWLLFSGFKGWMEGQPWMNSELDKDILVPGNDFYSEETARFIPGRINRLLVCKESNSELPLGVHYKRISNGIPNKSLKPYVAQINTFDGGKKHLGMFSSPEEAHKAWQEAKYENIFEAISWWRFDKEASKSFQVDVVESLLSRALKLKGEIETDRQTKNV